MHPQNITETPGQFALFMVFGINDTPDAAEKITAVCGDLPAIIRSMRNRFPDQQISCVTGFGAQAWRRLFPQQPVPAELEPFKEIRGERHVAVSTPGDLLFHIRTQRADVGYEIASLITTGLNGAVTAIDETHGFRYFDGRAIIGFVDGTENPEHDERADFAAIGDEDPHFTGGSYVFVQKYLHDMQAWNALPTEEQERAIGRRKYDDRELSDDVKPENAHNAVTNIQDADGNELKIVRGNMPFANPAKGEFGTYFIGYARTFSTTRTMLEHMFIGDPVGNTDRLLDFSTAVTGTLFFAPAADLLEELAG